MPRLDIVKKKELKIISYFLTIIFYKFKNYYIVQLICELVKFRGFLTGTKIRNRG